MNIKVQIFSAPSCNICAKASAVIQNLADEIGENKIQWRKVNVVEEIDLAVSLGILSTPAIVINDVLVFTGLPSTEKLRAEIFKRLDSV